MAKARTQRTSLTANVNSSEQPLPAAYRPLVSLDAHELSDIKRRTEQWMKGDLDGVVEYTTMTAFTIYQTMAAIALRDVGGRNGINARIQAARGAMEMAMKVVSMVEKLRKSKDTKPDAKAS